MALGVSYFVGLALQNTMSWNTLPIILKDLAPTLDEAKEVIDILLKELETLHSILQKKHQELETYQRRDEVLSDIAVKESNQNTSVETEPYSNDSSLPEPVEDEIKVFEVVEKRIDEGTYLQSSERTRRSDNKKHMIENVIDDKASENFERPDEN